MTIDDSKALARRLYAHLNDGNVEAVGDLVSPDYLEHNPVPGQGTGREGVLDRFSMIVGSLTPQFAVEDVVAEEDRVVVRWTNTGTQVGEFAGLPATGKPFTITGIDIYRVADGVLCEHWDVVDQLSMLGQLGMLPEFAS